MGEKEDEGRRRGAAVARVRVRNMGDERRRKYGPELYVVGIEVGWTPPFCYDLARRG